MANSDETCAAELPPKISHRSLHPRVERPLLRIVGGIVVSLNGRDVTNAC